MMNDECVFTKHVGEDFSILSTHVDDILQVATSQELYLELKNGLIKTYGNITANEKATSYLGMTIERSECGGYVKMSQGGLTDEVIKKFQKTANKTRSKTPAGDKLFDAERSSDGIPAWKFSDDDLDEEVTEDGPDDDETVDRTEFLSLVMTLMYLARLTRPDILLPVTYLASKSNGATKRDTKHLWRILRYLDDTRDIGLIIHCTDLSVHCSCDASYGVHTDGKSHTGFFVGLGEEMSFLHCRSGKQKLAATSSTDAEIIAAAEALKFQVWVRNLIAEMQIVELEKMVLRQDNRSSVMMYTDKAKNKRTKHILTKVSYIKSMVQGEMGIDR
jgi:hypothetical protein